VDRNKQDDPVWAPIFEAFAPVKAWLAEKKPDVLFMIYNDHVTSFFFDHYSAFTLGIDQRYEVADEGGGARNLPPVAGHDALSRHIGASLMAAEFDMSFFQDKKLDHGCLSPLSMLNNGNSDWDAHRAAGRGSVAVSGAVCRALLQAGQGFARCHRKLSGRPESGHRRHRRPVAPGAWRALRLQ
jgi:hypothetical protein